MSSGLKGNRKNCAYIESNMLTGNAQSMLGGVKSENPMWKGKLGNGIITAKIKLHKIKKIN